MKRSLIPAFLSLALIAIPSTSSAQAQELDADGCYYVQDDVRICPPPVQKMGTCFSFEPGCENPRDDLLPPQAFGGSNSEGSNQAPTEKEQGPASETQMVFGVQADFSGNNPFDLESFAQEQFPDTRSFSPTKETLPWYIASGLLGAAGIGLILLKKPLGINPSIANGIGGVTLALGLATGGVGCATTPALSRCEYVLVEKNGFEPLGGGNEFDNVEPPKEAKEGGLVALPPLDLKTQAAFGRDIPSTGTSLFKTRQVREEGETAEDCVSRCAVKGPFYLYLVCDGEPELVSTKLLSSEEQAQYCASACGVTSVQDFLEESNVGA